jgi:hypothetical protein
MTLELLQVVRLARDVPEFGLRAGTVGTVVDLLRGDGTAYEVEVVGPDGRAVFLGALSAADLVAEAAPAETPSTGHLDRAVKWSDLLGRTVATCRVEEHVFDARTKPLHVGLTFTDGLIITLGAASDGQSLQLASEHLRDYDMGEYGVVNVREHGTPCDVLAPGETIRRAHPLVDEDRLTIGLHITSDAGEVYVYNWGDELFIERELPSVVREALVPA